MAARAYGDFSSGLNGGTVEVAHTVHSGHMLQTGVRVGRNAPCPCGSGRKYKQCCLAKDEAAAAVVRAKAAKEAAVQPPEAEAETTASTRPPKPRTEQPWRAKTTRGFVPRSRTPRKVGGS